MSNSEGSNDLQTYLNDFKKEIDQTDDVSMNLTSEAWKALSEADAVTQKMLQEDDENLTNESECISEADSMYSLNITDKTIKIKLNKNSSDILSIQDESAADNQTNQKSNDDKAAIYDYNESMNETACEDDIDKHLDAPKTIHVVTESNSNVFKCGQCSYTTSKRFILSRHVKTHSDDRPFKCSVCDRGFKSNSALLNHVNSHLGKKPHHCKDCEMRFNTGGELVRHVRYKHTLEKPHKCGECDYSSVELSKMRRHMRCHTGERPYQCPHCTYASPDNFKLKRHLRTHTGEKPYECDICLARFTQSNSLKSHKLIHSVGDRPVFQCTLCPTTCGRKTDLQLHIQKLHHSDHPIKCKRCGKELPDRYTYKIHVKTHDGEKCFRCNICPYASISQRHLDMHMLLHTGEKPFVCEHCNTAFRQRQLLIRHINLYHTENYVPPTPQEKNHICPHCRRAFSRKGNLMRHMELHDTLSITEQEKLVLKIGRKMRIQSDGSIMIPAKDICLGKGLVNQELIGQHENIDSNNKDDENGTLETFEILEDIIDDEADEDATVFEYKTDNVSTKLENNKAIIMSSITIPNFINKNIKTETSITQNQNNILILPSSATQVGTNTTNMAIQHNLPIKIEIGSQDTINDVDDDDDDNEDFVVIEVIEDEDAGGDEENNGGESNTQIIAGDVLGKEIPLQSAGKQDLLNSFGFVDDEEYILPVEAGDED